VLDRDPRVYAQPDRFDVTRPPGQVLSFGHGPHACLGAHLARLEAHIALEVLLARVPTFELDPTRPIRWYRNAANRGPDARPIRFARP
jgi:cytochrome P450